MSIAEVVESYARSAGAPRRVELLSGAEGLGRGLSHLMESPSGDEGAVAARVLVGVATSGAEAASVTRLVGQLEASDLLVLVLRPAPEELPVGPVIQAACAEGARIVQAEALPGPRRTLLVMTKDRGVPQRSYLLGEPLLDSEATHLRQVNEWAVEGLQLRAQLEVAMVALAAERARCEAELSRMGKERAAESARVREQVQALEKTIRELRVRQSETKIVARTRKAAKLLRQDPIGGTKALVGAASRRLRH